MGASTTTPNINLPQFGDNDRPTWRGDVNGAFGDIDAAIASRATIASVDDANARIDITNTSVAGKVGKDTLVYNVRDYGAVGDGATDDTTAIQDAVTAAIVGAVVYFPAGVYKTTAAIAINKSLTIEGASKLTTRIVVTAANGIEIATGTKHVAVKSIGIATNINYTTTANALIGIKVSGIDTNQCGYHTYRDVYIQGFETGMQLTSFWSSVIDNVQVAMGKTCIDVYGLSENNMVTNCNLVAGPGSNTRVAGSACIRLNGQTSVSDATPRVSEGWVIKGNLMYGGDYGVDGVGYGNYIVSDNIIDSVQIAGVRSIHNGTAYGGHVLIAHNYIWLAGNAVTTVGAIEFANTVAGVRGNRVIGNDVGAYPGANAPYGIHIISPNASYIANNIFSGFNDSDINSSTGCIIVGNRCLSALVAPKYQIYSTAFNLISDNQATVYLAGGTVYPYPNAYSIVGGKKVGYSTAAPTALAWAVGDRVQNIAPAVGSPKAWVCTVAGTPGTWVSEGNL